MGISMRDGPYRKRNRIARGGSLRIAQIVHLYESVPPKLYGGTERVVAYLTEELIRRGHRVHLFASGDSTVDAPLTAGWPESLRLAGLSKYGDSYTLLNLGAAYERAHEFDIIHAHVDYWSFPFARLVSTPTVSTMHGRLDLPHLHPIYRAYRDLPLVSISNDQRSYLPFANWLGTVYHGLPDGVLKYQSEPGKYLAFLGRIAPEKRPDWAIEVARRAGLPLKIAAKVDPADREYFETKIKPMLAGPGVEFIGEVNEEEKSLFLGNALGLLFPIDWPEPFGLVMIEALACGTPVIARPCGSVREIIHDGITGYLADSVEEMVAAAHKIDRISRQNCRREFETRFTVTAMAAGYEELYHRLLDPEQITATASTAISLDKSPAHRPALALRASAAPRERE
ncbi:MAG TPA: glycosyltransferase family 4 protein [Candidatus Binataceae bacterium]|nr:glycosyltransferase family 4 protein [Candidatus Binataceae bacterium]